MKRNTPESVTMNNARNPSTARRTAVLAGMLALILPAAPISAQSSGTVEEGIAPPFEGASTSCNHFTCVVTADAEAGRLTLAAASVPGAFGSPGLPVDAMARVWTIHDLQEPAHRVTYEVELDLQGAGLAVGHGWTAITWQARTTDCGTAVFTQKCHAFSQAGFFPQTGPITLAATLQPLREPPELRPGPIVLSLTLSASSPSCWNFSCWAPEDVVAAAATVTVLDVRARIEPWAPSDLAVQSLDLDPNEARAGEPVNVTAHVANLGPNVSAPTTLAWSHAHDGAAEEAVASVPALGPGEQAIVEWGIVAVQGENTVAATVDPDADTQDTDRSNNEAVVTFTVQPAEGGLELEAVAYKEKGLQKADLTWTNATSAMVDVVRDDVVVATTDNDGAYTDPIDARGQGSYVYRVCEAGTATCSNQAVVEF